MRYRKIVLDTETTGLHPDQGDELLQVSIIDADNGNVIFDELVRPQLVTSWDEAQKINNISPDDVADKPHIIAYLDELQSVIDESRIIIGYNTSFDLRFLGAAGIDVDRGPDDGQLIVDVMQVYADRYGQWDADKQRFRWCKLSDAAAYIGYRAPNRYHDSVQDCLATLEIYRALQDQAEYETVIYREGRIYSHHIYYHYHIAINALQDVIESLESNTAADYEGEVYRIIDNKRSIVLMWPNVPF